MPRVEHFLAGSLLVVAGLLCGYLAGRRTREYGMIGVGGMLGLTACLIVVEWGWLALIAAYLALAGALWAWDALKECRGLWLRHQSDHTFNGASEHPKPHIANVQPFSGCDVQVEVYGQEMFFTGMSVVRIFVKSGDTVVVGQPLVSLESDMAVIDVQSPVAGVVKQLKVKFGDVVSAGVPIATIERVGTG